jgi:NHLM bacteriocin system ABC transporter ATP-binding protein
VSVTAGASVRIVAACGWVFVQNGTVRFGEDSDLAPLVAGELAFLTDTDWLVAEQAADVRLLATGDLLEAGRLWPVLGTQGTRFLAAIDRRIERRDQQEAALLQRRVVEDERLVGVATSALSSVLSRSRAQASLASVVGDVPTLAAMRLVCGRLGLTVTAPPSAAGVGVVDAVEAIARASRLRTRVIRLPARWWKRDIGPMVGRRRDDSPVALMPRRRGYDIVDVVAGTVTRVDRDSAASLSPLASVVYRPLPEGATRGWRLLRFGLRGAGRELATFLWCGLVLALLGLFVPVLSGQVLGRFVPHGERTLIIDAGLVVIASGVVAAVFSAVQNLAVLRLEGRMSATIQAAVWDHLLALPVRFFSQYSVGDISLAATAVNAVRDALSGVATAAGLALMIGAANLVLLFFYSVQLALLVVGMVLVCIGVAAVAGRYEIRLQRELFERQRKLSAKVFQMLNGMAKLRVAAAEDRAFAQWAGDFTRVRAIGVRARQIQNTVTVVNAAITLPASLVIFVLVAQVVHLSTAAFLSFFAAYTLLLSSLLQFTGVAITVLSVVPLLDSVEPITTSEREVTEEKADPGELSGAIRFNHVSFQYSDDGPKLIDDVSFSIRAGEFVAVVGPTGCGKSTLVRLLLGFEQPTSGSVMFDGLDLGRLDVTAVRRQCGVVLQHGSLLAGDIKTNIIGNGLFTEDDAWQAARLAGLAEDIEAMPMKMYTMLSEGASTLSGGQRQRLMIARALVSRPRIVILDEATSALDNPTQAAVAESTRQLHATRIVIAHRLSTILHADRIIVLDAGRIVQQGSYDELMQDGDGMFARLVRRQIA